MNKLFLAITLLIFTLVLPINTHAQDYNGALTFCGLSSSGPGQISIQVVTSESTGDAFNTAITQGGSNIAFSLYTVTGGSVPNNTTTRTITISNITAPAGTYGLSVVWPRSVSDRCSYTNAFTIDGSGNITLNATGGSPPPAALLSGGNPCDGNSCQTAIGNLSIDTASGDFAGGFLSVALGVAGGIALIIMVVGSIRILMASGDPQKIASGRDLIVAAVAGLLFLIFSVLILRFIGSDLLNLFTAT